MKKGISNVWLAMSVFLLVMASTGTGEIIFVDADVTGANNGSSWEDAFNYLQDALAAAQSGDQIWVAEGAYRPDEDTAYPDGTGDREATFQLISGVAIYGGYAGFGESDPNERDVELYETILSGDLNGDDVDVNDPCDLLNEPTRAENSYHVVKGSGTDASAVIDGFTITAGYNDFEAPIPPSGGGMLNREGSPTVRNCTFSSNMALALGYGMGGGMHNYNSSATIINCTFTGNSSRFGGGMYNRNWRSNNKTVVVNCTFIGNYAKGKGGGVRNFTSSPIITNCTFSGNSAEYGGGMFNNFDCTPMVSNCSFTGNIAVKDGGGICNENNPYYGDSTPIVTNCILWNNSDSGGTDEYAQICGGIPTVNYNCVQGWTGTLGGVGNIGDDPCFIEPGYWADWVWVDGDYHLLPDSPCINTGNPNGDYTGQTDIDGDQRVINGRVDMGADEFRGPIYVDNDAPEDPGPNNPDISDSNENGSLAHPFDAIQEAIDVASNGETVVVLDGTYTGDGNRDIDFLGKAITVRSESGPENTIIDCEHNGRGFYFHNGETLSSRLEGITICNGNEYKGCSIYIVNSSPKILNCLIKDSSRLNGHGAIFCDNNSSAEIIDCVFENNNMENGSGIKCEHGGDIKIRGCEFYRGGDSAIYCEYDVKVTIENCIIMDTNGTAAYHAPPAIYLVEIDNASVINNCIIANNHSTRWSAGIWCIRCAPTITNCTIVGNSSNEPGGGIGCYDADPVISNCIIWGNQPPSGPQIVLKAGSNPSISYCDVQGGWPGDGNIDADPCFVDADSNDYHLLPGSPCIDAGDNTAVPADTADLDGDGNTTEPIPWDLDGNPRIVDGNDDGNLVVDMGAFEAMVSCFGVNHIKIETKAGKKGNKVELKGTFAPASPIDLAVDDVAYIIDDGQGNALVFLIPAGSFEPDGKPGKQKFKFHSAKGSEPDIKARFDFDKCKFELKAKRVQGTDEITSTTLAIELWAGANVAQEVVEVKIKPKHLEYKREPKLSCCPKCKGIALLEVTNDQGVFVFEPEPGKEKLKRKTVVDDGVNGRVKIDTSCSKPLEVGDVFGVYTVTDLIKIFDD